MTYIGSNITGSAIGFKLDSLLKLSDTRARNNKMTLMHYLCKVKYCELLPRFHDINGLDGCYSFQPLEGGKLDMIKSDMKIGTLSKSSSSVGGALLRPFCYCIHVKLHE